MSMELSANATNDLQSKRGCLFYIKRVIKGISFLITGIVLLMLLGVAYQTIATETDRGVYSPRGQLYTVNGHQMHIYCIGEGSPTVVLEAGWGAESLWWYRVQNQLAEDTRVCAYDRPGMGFSEWTTQSRDPITVVSELHTLLDMADIEPPYVVVGHSYGAVLVRVFAYQYPDDVTGIVLVDSTFILPTHFDSEAEIEQWTASNDAIQGVMRVLSRVGVIRLTSAGDFYGYGYPAGIVPQMVALRSPNQAFDTSYEENIPVRLALTEASAAAQDFGDRPLVILWASESASTQAQFTEYRAEMTTFSSNSVTRMVEGADHGSILGNELYAQQVSDSILDVIDSADTGEPLTP